uniref:Uncharacterized protein n=1 Tax=viral metagenome TaxID=1070528 RepID=A0A6M3LRB5_9ZZZZ
MEREMIDLGYMNGWHEGAPEIITKCRKLKHMIFSQNVGKCLNRYGCEICGYSYLIDSSG